ncbi:hypothetical protein niasHT_026088 [Heterodera trifolii]|uniref:Uncharacterized protein n=1 Tax=Heterodera trifolii TaxID=157864 RepID=A0ABD2KRZ1_9BILA
MFYYFFELLIAYFNASLALLRVFVLGFCYAIREFYTDYTGNLKFVPKNKLFQSKVAEWKKSLLQLNGDIERKTKRNEGEEVQQNDHQQNSLIAVLTGGDGTIGSEILDYLLSLDFFVFVIGMNAPQLGSDRMLFVPCDLSDKNQVFEAVESVLLGCSHVDLLVLNAAMMLCPDAGAFAFPLFYFFPPPSLFGWLPFRIGRFGCSIIEPHLAVNVLANAQLFASFAGRLECSRFRSPRAVFLSSCTAHAGELSLLLENEEKFWCRRINDYKSYADSKLLLSIYVKHLSHILKIRQSKIAVVSVHPGVVPGKLYRNVFWPFRLFINGFLRPFLRSPLLAATRVLDVAFSDDLREGAYYEDSRVTALKCADDPEFVWSVGTSVRDMIVDSNENSFNKSESTE